MKKYSLSKNMCELPLELITLILEKVDLPTFCSVALTCQQWYNATEMNSHLIFLKLCGAKDIKTALKNIAAAYHNYSIYCLECPNTTCCSLGLPKKCPKCGGKIRTDKTEI